MSHPDPRCCAGGFRHTSFLPASGDSDRRAPHLLDTASTDAQAATEDECAAFFIDLPSLSEGQLDHLRDVGLLPPPPLARGDAREVTGKAAALLGVESDDAGGEGDGGATRGEGSGSPDGDGIGVAPPFDPYAVRLLRDAHANYLSNALSNPLPRGFVSLDASHPWMVYWCLHSLDLLGHFDAPLANTSSAQGLRRNNGVAGALEDVEVSQKAQLLQRIVSTLDHCWADATLEFRDAEVAKDARLRQLLATEGLRENPTCDNTESTKRTITGGGFGGGPQQMPHVAVTYAAVLSLCIVAGIGLMQSDDHPYHEPGERAMGILTQRRLRLYAFFLTLRERHGGGRHDDDSEGDEETRTSFRMQHDGEEDVRAAYCILAPCYLLGLLQDDDQGNAARDGGGGNPLRSPAISRHIASCQTFEGGFGAEPSTEAHGGYTFCALAALRILGSVAAIDARALAAWLARRQTGFEGGFCGRTNKLVDGCYSFWQGGAVAVLDGWRGGEGDSSSSKEGNALAAEFPELSFDEVMLQRYILLCAQDVNGGLRDKPSKPKDFYHSCYNLSGLSVAQHALRPWPPSSEDRETASKDLLGEKFNHLFGDASVNIIGRTDPVINIRCERVKFIRSQQQFC